MISSVNHGIVDDIVGSTVSYYDYKKGNQLSVENKLHTFVCFKHGLVNTLSLSIVIKSKKLSLNINYN